MPQVTSESKAVDVYGTEVIFEPDEERNYRAIVDSEKLDVRKNNQLYNACYYSFMVSTEFQKARNFLTILRLLLPLPK